MTDELNADPPGAHPGEPDPWVEARKKVVTVECGPGWKGLYEPLLALCAARNVPVLQVKEKFGGLRFYVEWTAPERASVQQIISAAENYSYHVCEHCGEDGIAGWSPVLPGSRMMPDYKVTTGPSPSRRWIKSLCAPCRETWDKE